MSATQSQIVIGFDFSHSSRAALERAIAIAVGAPLHVLHFVCAIEPHIPVPTIAPEGAVDYQYAERVQIALTGEVEAELRRAGAGRVHFCVHVRIGKPADEILDVARGVGADLIIVGSKHVTTLERLVLGSVSAKVARDAGCTVEIARPKTYPSVDLAVVTEVEPSHHYVPPHRYTYEERRVILRPDAWPLY